MTTQQSQLRGFWLFRGLTVFLSIFFCSHGWARMDFDSADRKALTEIEQQVQLLKEGVYQSKARLRDLEQSVLTGKISGSKAFIQFENRAEGFFSFTSAQFFLDDQPLYQVETQSKDGKKTTTPVAIVTVFDGDIPSGDHFLRAKIAYRGSDRSVYSAFPYFKDHTFELETNEKFSVDYGKTSVVKLTAIDKGYFKTDLKERLTLDIATFKDWGAEPKE